ncbi:MAG: DUF1549 domain-containing protein, partial [Acidobacteria bacterium]|nr:DUF1549 domain-containing protein [Acidobacteriota bacterium]
LLASPRFGERMAFRWLDAARYADTNGYQIDGDRSAWRWRDWVIEAFNANKPFDEFVIEQLAGDLLPNPTLDQRIATAFNRNHRINAEGGIVPEEYRIEYVVDRVDTTSTVFMGLTFGCARCHNHKYDPLSQKEFYQLSAYFNSIDEDGHSFDWGNSPPVMAAPTREQQAQLAKFDQQIALAENDYNRLAKKFSGKQRDWEKTFGVPPSGGNGGFSRTAGDEHDAQPPEGGTPNGIPEEKLIVRIPFDENQLPVFNSSDRAYHNQEDIKKKDKIGEPGGFKDGQPRFVASPLGQAVAFDGKLYFDGGLNADFRYKTTSSDYRERFTIAAWVYPESEQSGSIVTKISDSPADVENGIPRAEGYGLYFLNGKLHFNMVFRWGEDTLRVETEPLPVKQWHHVAVVFDGLKQWEERLKIFVNGQETKLKWNQRNFYLLFGGSRNTLKIGAGGGPQFRFKGALDEVRMYSRALESDEIAALACADSLESIAALPAKKRSAAQNWKLNRAFLNSAAPEELKQAQARLAELKQQRQKFVDDLPSLMVMQELPTPRPAHVLKRGAYDAPGEVVGRAVPAVLPPLAADLPNNRLGFARWLMSKEHPLTARVTVNRFWQMFFGTGLVKTAEDFGAQGELPTHPELLDWQAVAFRDGGTEGQRDGGTGRRGDAAKAWDVRALLKTIVMSATYRQSSKQSSQSESRIPQSS